MDDLYGHGLVSYVIHPLLRGLRPSEEGRPELKLCVGTSLFRALFASFHSQFFLPAFFCHFILFHSCCSLAQVLGTTLVYEFHISYIHTEWYSLFSRNYMKYGSSLARRFAYQKRTIIITKY